MDIPIAPVRAAADRVVRTVEARTTIPILGNIRLEAGPDGLMLTATDLDIEAVERVPEAAGELPAITVPAHLFADVLRKAPGETAKLAIGDRGPTVSAGRSRTTMGILPAADFPVLAMEESAATFDLDARTLASSLETVRFAVSSEETRYYLNGVHVHPGRDRDGRGRRHQVTTDGHRPAWLRLPLPEGAEAMPRVILPKKTVDLVAKMLAKADGSARLEVSDTKVRLRHGHLVLTSKLIDGTFPDYGRAVPLDPSGRVTLPRADLADAIGRVMTMSGGRTSRAVRLEVADAPAPALRLSMENADMASEARDELAVDPARTAGAVIIGANGRYLADNLAVLTGPTVTVHFDYPGAPMLILDPAAPDRTFVLMPMRV